MKNTLLFLFLVSSLCSSAQDSILILDTKKHNEWFERLDSSSLPIKTELIRERLISDTCVFVMEYFPDGITLESFPSLVEIKKRRELGVVKPSYLFSFKGQSRLIKFENFTKNEDAEILSKVICVENIQEIHTETNETNLAIYGRHGAGGIVYVALKRRRVWKIIEELELVDHYGFVVE